ncbi:ATF1 [[Candida] subhashii]|uniref:ATF1 n=1 Tax=[Candida] subhashii TaxID=561895 RepID=A0A8J5QGX2_9ASCO|nr:ATF1 [[Candida] subhashii]KAG7664446.1 ATF1 [[Candida] subhashii]
MTTDPLVPDVITSRPLGIMETFFRCRTACGFYKNFQVTSTYNQDLQNNLDLLYKALRKTLIDYAILATNIKYDNQLGTYVYSPINNVKYGDILSIEQNDEEYLDDKQFVTEKFMKKVNDITFTLYTNEILFKLILVDKNQLCFVVEHTIADGLVGNYFHEILVENLAYCDQQNNTQEYLENYGPTPDKITFDSCIFDFESDKQYIKYSLPPPIDPFLEDIDLDHTYNNPNFHEKVTPKGQTKWKGRFPESSPTFTASFKLINFTPSQTRQIIQKCKSENVTLTSYLEVIQAISLRHIYPPNQYMSIKVAMTLRRHYDPTKAPVEYQKVLTTPTYKNMGNSPHMGFAENIPKLSTTLDWDYVRKINTNLFNSARNTRALHILKPFRDNHDPKSDNPEIFEGKIGKPMDDSVKISNLGYINVPEYPGDAGRMWTIENMVFAQDMAFYAADFMLNCISTPKGGMNLVLSYLERPEMRDGEDMERVVEELRVNMLKYAE